MEGKKYLRDKDDELMYWFYEFINTYTHYFVTPKVVILADPFYQYMPLKTTHLSVLFLNESAQH